MTSNKYNKKNCNVSTLLCKTNAFRISHLPAYICTDVHRGGVWLSRRQHNREATLPAPSSESLHFHDPLLNSGSSHIYYFPEIKCHSEKTFKSPKTPTPTAYIELPTALKGFLWFRLRTCHLQLFFQNIVLEWSAWVWPIKTQMTLHSSYHQV